MTERRRISHETFEARFFAGARRIAPGIWLDGDGDLHFSVPELLALVELPDTPDNREVVYQLVEDLLRGAHPTATIVRHDPD